MARGFRLPGCVASEQNGAVLRDLHCTLIGPFAFGPEPVRIMVALIVIGEPADKPREESGNDKS